MNRSHVTLTHSARAAIVTLTRPESSNALARETVRQLGEVVHELVHDRELRAIVITGAGTRAFCAGADLRERVTMTEPAVLEMLEAYRTELGIIEESPLPVVAAINGHALGGGLELALLCDLRIAAPHACFGLPETGLGIIPGAGGTQRLTRLVGTGRAKELILLARRLDAKTALEFGLIERIAKTGDIVAEALQWIAPILEGAPLAQRAALRAIDAAHDLELKAGLAFELEQYRTCLASEDRREALLARAEGRPARFVGR